MNNKKTTAIVCAIVAVVAAFGLLIGSGFGFIPLVWGAHPAPEQGAELTAGAYVQADVHFIMDICAVERTENDNIAAYYAVAPMGNTFIMIRFPAAEYENVLTMKQATDDYLSGKSGMAVHLSVTGTTVTMDEETKVYLEKWFENNAEKMSQTGLIAAVEDYSVYLSDVAVESGMVGSVRQVSILTAACCSVAALILLVLAVLLFILAGIGAFDKKAETKKKAGPSAAPEAEESAVEESDPAVGEVPVQEETPAAAPTETESETDGEDTDEEEEEDNDDTDDGAEDEDGDA